MKFSKLRDRLILVLERVETDFKGRVLFHAAFFKGLQKIELHKKYKWYSQAVFLLNR